MASVLKTSAEGRKCMFPGCTQTLSIYNHEAHCHLHRDQIAAKQHRILSATAPFVGGKEDVSKL